MSTISINYFYEIERVSNSLLSYNQHFFNVFVYVPSGFESYEKRANLMSVSIISYVYCYIYEYAGIEAKWISRILSNYIPNRIE